MQPRAKNSAPKESAVEYRKRRGLTDDTWHWCRNCSNWPTSNFESTLVKPTTGELCLQCTTKEKAGKCAKTVIC